MKYGLQMESFDAYHNFPVCNVASRTSGMVLFDFTVVFHILTAPLLCKVATLLVYCTTENTAA